MHKHMTAHISTCIHDHSCKCANLGNVRERERASERERERREREREIDVNLEHALFVHATSTGMCVNLWQVGLMQLMHILYVRKF